MDGKTAIAITSVICLTIIGIVAMFALPDASKLIYTLAAIIGGVAGYELKPVVVLIWKRILKRK